MRYCMLNKTIACLLLIQFFSSTETALAQIPSFSLGWWKQQSIAGLLRFEGQYRAQETVFRNNVRETPRTALYDGEMLLNSRSYLWHPNFMNIDLTLDYNPGSRRDRFLVLPDRSESRTAEKAQAQFLFFNQRPLSLVLFTNYNHTFVNREYASNVEMYRTDFGSNLNYRNGIANLSLGYVDEDWQQTELQIDQRFSNRRRGLHSELSKSFSSYDDHRLTGAVDHYTRQYSDLVKTFSNISTVNLADNFYFNKAKTSALNSYTSYYDQSRDTRLKRWLVVENAVWSLPAHLKLAGNYQYARFSQTSLEYRQHTGSGSLEHRLFASLFSRLTHEFSDLQQTTFSEHINRSDLAFNYRKNIPFGILNLGYDYRFQRQDRSSRSGPLRIGVERHVLNDDVLNEQLNNPFIDAASVVVKDETGVINYRRTIDYYLIPLGDYLVIQRVPGGNIPNGTSVYVDYSAREQDSFGFDMNSNNASANVALFKQMFEIYFRYFNQDYSRLHITDERILKTALQRIYGVRFNYGLLTAAWEWDDYKSNILPYTARQYQVGLNAAASAQLNASLSGNWRDVEIHQLGEKQKIADLSMQMSYRVSQQSRLNLEGGYRFQQGRGLDLKLGSLRGEYLVGYRQVSLAAGVEVYRRNFSGETINYNGVYLRLDRKL
jgi:hypothetical protein